MTAKPPKRLSTPVFRVSLEATAEILMRLGVTLVLAASCAPSFGARFGIEHLGKLARVADPQISSDGKSIVAVISRPNYQTNHYAAELVLIDTATRKQRVLTR